jgi:hypothetical protein
LQVTSAARPSDAERERALERLKRHYGEGRLTIEELEARVERVFRSSRRLELPGYLLEVPFALVRRGLRWRVRRLQRRVLRGHLALYTTANGTALGIWALTGAGVFWPAWVLLPTTAVLAWHGILSRRLTRALNRRRW